MELKERPRDPGGGKQGRRGPRLGLRPPDLGQRGDGPQEDGTGNAPNRYAVQKAESAAKQGLSQADLKTRDAMKALAKKGKQGIQRQKQRKQLQAASAAKTYADKGKKRLQLQRAGAARYQLLSSRRVESRNYTARTRDAARTGTPSPRLRTTAATPDRLKQRARLDRAHLGTRHGTALKTRQHPLKVTEAAGRVKQAAAGKTAQKAAQIAEEHGRHTLIVQAQKAARKTLTLSRKAAEVAAKALAQVAGAALAVVGIPLMLVLLVAALIGAVANSPLGILFSSSGQIVGLYNFYSLEQAKGLIEEEYQSQIQAIINGVSHDRLEMEYAGSPDNVRIDNWPEVVAVYAAKTASNDADGMDVTVIDTLRLFKMQEVFFDMNTITYTTRTETGDEDEETVLVITVTSRTAHQQASAYGFDAEKLEFVDLMLTDPELYGLLRELLGYTRIGGGGVSDAVLQELLDQLDPNDIGGRIVLAASTRMGDPYSIPKAGEGSYIDCSLLVRYAYNAVGISMPRTAAEQAQYCDENGMSISLSDLQPGDLIFWSYEESIRYKSIGHVGIYAGGGLVIHASSVDMQVVCEPLFHAGNQVMYGHPWEAGQG